MEAPLAEQNFIPMRQITEGQVGGGGAQGKSKRKKQRELETDTQSLTSRHREGGGRDTEIE